MWESLAREGKGHQHRLFKVKMSFLPQQYYSVSVCIHACMAACTRVCVCVCVCVRERDGKWIMLITIFIYPGGLCGLTVWYSGLHGESVY